MRQCRAEMVAMGATVVPRTCPVHGLGPCPKPSSRGLKVKKLTETAILPSKSYDHDAGFDLYADEKVTLYQGEQHLVSTGIAMQIPPGFVGLIWPRSGLATKQGIDTLAGVVDSGYRGEVKVCLTFNTFITLALDVNRWFALPSVIEIAKGERVAQILIQEVPNFKIIEVEELEDSDRGIKGFGSSNEHFITY